MKLTATASDAPTITLVNTGADLTFTYRDYTDSAQDAAKTVSASGVKVQPGQTVTVTAQYKAGYYAPAVTAAGGRIATLGPRILRCETAPLAALTVLMERSGNLR